MKIENETQYEKASERAEVLFGAKKGSPQDKELQEILLALKEYDDDFIKMLKDNS